MNKPRTSVKKQITDIQAIRVELDEEDRELMQMFRSRQAIVNDALLVQDGEEMYLVSKTHLARTRKLIQDITNAGIIGVAVFVLLLQTVLMLKRVVNPLRCLPWMAVVLFAIMVYRFAIGKIRKGWLGWPKK